MGDAGLEQVLTERPELTAVRVLLVDSRRERMYLDEALSVLEAAPERSGEIWGALGRLVEHPPPHLRSWYLQSTWLEEAGERDRLVEHLSRLRDLAGADHGFIGQALDRLRAASTLSHAAQWLALRTAIELDDDEKAVALLEELLGRPGEEPDAILAVVDDLRRERREDTLLLLADLRLSAGAKRVSRVVGAGRDALADPVEQEVRKQALEDMLEIRNLGEARSDRPYLQASLDLALLCERREPAEQAYSRLLVMDAAAPEKSLESARSFMAVFGADLSRLNDSGEALIGLGKMDDALATIRSVADWESDADAGLTAARRLAEMAATGENGGFKACRLASELAARDGDAEAALAFATRANDQENRERVLDLLLAHSESFPGEPRFDIAVAIDVCESTGALERGAEHLGVALTREPRLCGTVYEHAERFSSQSPRSAPIQSVKARAATLRAVAEPEAADLAVADLTRLLELDQDRREEALERVESVLEHRPEHLGGHFLRMRTLRALGRTRDAIEEARILVKLAEDPAENVDARTNLADALEEIDAWVDALDEWRGFDEVKGATEEDRDRVLERIRLNFLGRAGFEARNAAEDPAIRRACLALMAGQPEGALAAIPPAGDEMDLSSLAARGAALLALRRHGQVIEELRPHLEKVGTAPPLDPFEREFLFSLGMASLEVGDDDWAIQCLELLARDMPEYRGVRLILDRFYCLRTGGGPGRAGADLSITDTLEEVSHGS
jgi:tetratricopeptide (TPR) repeat protein